MDCFRQKRRRNKEGQEEPKLRQISPAHSRTSTLTQGPAPPPPRPNSDPPRLPKVGSYGLWVGTPGISASTPSPAYAPFGGGGGGGGRTHHLMQPAVLMQRATSDPRLLHNHRGGAVYSIGGYQQRIYHSQGIPSPLSPVYEIRDPHDGSVYDVYQIGGAKLLHESGKTGKGGNRLQRSQSDVTTEPSRRAYRTKHSTAELRASRNSSYRDSSPASTATARTSASLNRQNANNLSKDATQVHPQRAVSNPIYIESVEKGVPEEKVAVVASATDSMKLLAKNKTDGQKTVGQSDNGNSTPSVPANPPGGVSSPPPASTVAAATVSSSSSSSPQHYNYQADIYAVPNKEAGGTRSGVAHPSPAQGVLATVPDQSVGTDPVTASAGRAGSFIPENHPGDVEDPVDYIYQEVGNLCDHDPSQAHSSPYQELGEVVSHSQDKAVSAASTVMVVVAGPGSAGDADEAARASGEAAVGSEVAAASAVRSVGEAGGASGQTEDRPARKKLQEQWSTDTEGTSDDLTRAGKHISVTAEAFEFLDTYLSDEDGAEISSPPKSPVMTDRSHL